MFRESREPIFPPEAVNQSPFFKPSSQFERHLTAYNGRRGWGRIHDPVDPDNFPPGTPPETIRYWVNSFGEKRTRKRKKVTPTPSSRQENLSSHGPLLHMPIFGPQNGEIMTVVDEGGDFVTVYTEDPEEHGRLNPTLLDRKDYKEYIRKQTRCK